MAYTTDYCLWLIRFLKYEWRWRSNSITQQANSVTEELNCITKGKTLHFMCTNYNSLVLCSFAMRRVTPTAFEDFSKRIFTSQKPLNFVAYANIATRARHRYPLQAVTCEKTVSSRLAALSALDLTTPVFSKWWNSRSISPLPIMKVRTQV